MEIRERGGVGGGGGDQRLSTGKHSYYCTFCVECSIREINIFQRTIIYIRSPELD